MSQSGQAIEPRQPIEALEEALSHLREADQDDAAAIELAAARCLMADSDARNRFMLYRETGEALLECGRTEEAEAFAIRSLMALPRYGAAFRLLGRVAEARGDAAEAAQCHRYGLPERVRDRWFADMPLRRVGLQRGPMSESKDLSDELPPAANARVTPALPSNATCCAHLGPGTASPCGSYRHERSNP